MLTIYTDTQGGDVKGIAPRIASSDSSSLNSSAQLDNDIESSIRKTGTIQPEEKADTELATMLEAVRLLLANHQPDLAAKTINEIYSGLSSRELELFKGLFFEQAAQYKPDTDLERLKQLYLVGAGVFDEVRFWEGAAVIAEKQKDWPGALQALRKATMLESRPDELANKLKALLRNSNRLRAYYEALGDELGIRALYQDLYDEHPNHPRFQLELAQSHLRLGDKKSAVPLLKLLQYDPDLGVLAKQKLSKIQSESTQPVAVLEKQVDQDRAPSDIVVPLRRIGNSFAVNSVVEGRSVTMLLDTGASITALSRDLVTRLNLQATGQVIQLSTANGITKSRLFKVERLRLGRVYIEDAVIAEIDLRGSSTFQGLLGTDLLNQANPNYSYIIDNSKNALIFKRK